MSQTRDEIIESLYNTGKISFKEAMILASQPEKELEPGLMDGTVVGTIKADPIITLTKKVANDIFGTEIDPDGEDIMSFDVDRIVKTMTCLNWTWKRCCEKVPTREDIIREGTSLVKDVIKGLVDEHKEKPEEEVSWTSSCGGLEARGWYDPNENMLSVELRFVVEEWSVDRYHNDETPEIAELFK